MPTQIKIIIAVVLSLVIGSFISSTFDNVKQVYNTSIEYNTQLESKTQDVISTYDAYYLSYKDQYDLGSLSKEGFIELAKIAMTARADGKNVAWKWVQENQPIPYSEFSAIYTNLVEFTKERYAQVNNLERQRQAIVQQHNQNILKFPNNLYNRWLGIKPLVYKAGYVSDSTKRLFNIK